MLPDSDKAFYIFSALDHKRVFRCYFDEEKHFAYEISLKPLIPTPAQIVDDLLRRFPKLERARVHFVPFFGEALSEEKKLFLVLYDQNLQLGGGHVWPDFLKKLPKTRERLAFLKAFQVVMGAHKENIKALDVRDLRPISDTDLPKS